ncbi:hypothetical protein CPC08DRAFT_712170 [Agrocybe pediades]|nr:hypothetical protein CPC08DRAFT_712170 [Agrocybe pediades]
MTHGLFPSSSPLSFGWPRFVSCFPQAAVPGSALVSAVQDQSIDFRDILLASCHHVSRRQICPPKADFASVRILDKS